MEDDGKLIEVEGRLVGLSGLDALFDEFSSRDMSDAEAIKDELLERVADVLGFAAVLTVAAILGKQICAFGVLQKGLDKISVGIGMVPRGEVGLVFADIGSALMLGGKPVIGMDVFSAVVIMVVITTMMTPPALKWSLSRGARTERSQEAVVEQEEEV